VDRLPAHPLDSGVGDVGACQRRLTLPEVPDPHGRLGPGPALAGLRDRVERTDHEHQIVGPRGVEGVRERVLDGISTDHLAGVGRLEDAGEDRHRLGAVDVGAAGHHAVGARKRGRHAGVVLVGERPDHQVEGLVVVARERLRDRLAGAGVVRAVQHRQRPPVHDLEAAGPGGAVQSPDQRPLDGRQTAQFLADLAGQRRGDAGVARLVGTREGDPGVRVPVRPGQRDGGLGDSPEPVVAGAHVRAVVVRDGQHLAVLPDGGQRLPRSAGDQRATRGGHGGLVPGDLGDRLPQEVGVF
jgi:hypothetical protein